MMTTTQDANERKLPKGEFLLRDVTPRQKQIARRKSAQTKRVVAMLRRVGL